MGESERSALLLKVIEEALGVLETLPASQEALRFEREGDGLRATIESWREMPPGSVTRRSITQRVHRLHSEAMKYARQETAPEAATNQPASGPRSKRGDAEGNERPTVPPPFSMEAFAWDMTAPKSKQRPPSDPPALWQSTDTEAFAIDVELDDALAGWDDRAAPQTAPSFEEVRKLSPSSIERAVVALLEDSASPALSQREIEDPAASVLERYRAGDYEAALDIADTVLTQTPGNRLVRQCRDKCRHALAKVYAEKLGPLDRIPVVVTPSAPSTSLPVDHRTGFLLSLIDGTSSLEAILDACSVPRLDALRLLHELMQRGIIGFK